MSPHGVHSPSILSSLIFYYCGFWAAFPAVPLLCHLYSPSTHVPLPPCQTSTEWGRWCWVTATLKWKGNGPGPCSEVHRREGGGWHYDGGGVFYWPKYNKLYCVQIWVTNRDSTSSTCLPGTCSLVSAYLQNNAAENDKLLWNKRIYAD